MSKVGPGEVPEDACSPKFRIDMEWLDDVNAERKKEQADRVSCETFEIIMDRLEKDWFDLVRLSHIALIPYLNFADRQRTYPSRTWQCHRRIQLVPFVMTRRARTRTRSFFAMGVILLYIKTAMVYRIFLKVNGCAASAPSHPKHRW